MIDDLEFGWIALEESLAVVVVGNGHSNKYAAFGWVSSE